MPRGRRTGVDTIDYPEGLAVMQVTGRHTGQLSGIGFFVAGL